MTLTKTETYTFSDAIGLAKAVHQYTQNNVWVNYDAAAGTLYINFTPSPIEADDSVLKDNGIIVRYRDTEIIGCTVLNVKER